MICRLLMVDENDLLFARIALERSGVDFEIQAFDALPAAQRGHAAVVMLTSSSELGTERGNMTMSLTDRAEQMPFFRNTGRALVRHGSHAHAGMATVTLWNNGIGITPEDMEQLFQPFARLNLRREFAGSGLGLAICRQIKTPTAARSACNHSRARVPRSR